MKNVAVSLMAILFAACSGNKSPHSLQQEKEDLSAKELLQGIWLDDETESPLMRVEGDTIYYADAQSTPIAFKIMRDILYTYGNDTEVTKRDSVVTYNGTRYRAYVYINPSKMRVIKTTYSEDGISMDNVYYDNVMHICVYEGKKSLFASDITKQMFDKVVPADFLAQSILSDTKFVKVNRNGFHYQAVLAIPETSIYSVVNMEVSFKGDLEITSSK